MNRLQNELLSILDVEIRKDDPTYYVFSIAVGLAEESLTQGNAKHVKDADVQVRIHTSPWENLNVHYPMIIICRNKYILKIP